MSDYKKTLRFVIIVQIFAKYHLGKILTSYIYLTAMVIINNFTQNSGISLQVKNLSKFIANADTKQADITYETFKSGYLHSFDAITNFEYTGGQYKKRQIPPKGITKPAMRKGYNPGNRGRITDPAKRKGIILANRRGNIPGGITKPTMSRENLPRTVIVGSGVNPRF